MKTKFGTLFILSFFFFLACKKEKKEEEYWPLGNYWQGPQTYGKVQAFRNGEFWEASAIASIVGPNQTCDISFGTIDPVDSVPTEDLSFSRVPFRVGQFSVYNTIVVVNDPIWKDSLGSIYGLLYDDLYGPAFYPDTTRHSWIRIESIDSIQKTIKGQFDVIYRIGPDGEKNTHYPHEVHFSNGVFEVKLYP